MGDDMRPSWEIIPLPPLWAELTPEQRRAVLAGEVPAKGMTQAEIEELYGGPIEPE